MKGKSDCLVSFTRGGQGLRVRVSSSVLALFGAAIERTAREAASGFEDASGELAIDDDGALDYVVRARVEAALLGAGLERRSEESAGANGREARPSGRGRNRRSRLYLPGNQPDLVPNAGLFGADCLVLDLEDSVAPSSKAEARILVGKTLRIGRPFFRDSEIVVRINPLSGSYGRDDLAELSGCLPDALILPKCESADDVLELDAALAEIEAARGAEVGGTLIMPLVETARGVLAASSIAAASPRVAAICFGAEDFSRDIGARRTASGSEAICARQDIVLAAAAAGIQAQDSVFSDVEDDEGLAAYCAASRALGFGGAGLIHPRQIAIAHQAYTPSEAELEEAAQITAALDEAQARGSGVASLDGKMIDAPVAERARRLMALRSPAATGGRH